MAKKRKRRLTTEAVVFNPVGHVLLVKQGQAGRGWELPGGKVKQQESLTDAIVREVKEEAGVEVVPLRLIGAYFISEETTHDFVIECRLVHPDASLQPNPPETVDCRFFPVTDLPAKLSGFTIDRIHDALRGEIHSLPVELTKRQWLG